MIRSITIDCAEPARIAGFWAALLGWEHEVEGDVADVFDRIVEAHRKPTRPRCSSACSTGTARVC